MNKLARGLATAAIASALIVAPAAAANASYVPGAAAPTAPAVVTPGSTFNIVFPAGSFAPGESVTITLVGDNAAGATLASTASITKTADEVGGLTVSVTLPAGATGDYSAVGTSATSTAAVSFNVVAADSAADDADGLANTGSESAAAFWFAGGLLALGATTVVTLNVVRRNRAQA